MIRSLRLCLVLPFAAVVGPVAIPTVARAQVGVETLVVAGDASVDANAGGWTGPTLVGQEIDDAVAPPRDSPPPSAPSSEDVEDVAVETSPPSRPSMDAGGWAWFGGQSGLLVLTSPWVIWAVADEDGGPIGAAVQLGAIGMGFGALFEELAREGDWDPGVGWALAGVYPGIAMGLLGGALATELAGDNASGGDAAAVLAVSATAGLLVGALATYARADAHGDAHASLTGFWLGLLGASLTSLAAAAIVDDVGDHPEELLLASLTGAALGALVPMLFDL